MIIDQSLLTCVPALMPNDPSIPNPITTVMGTVYTFQQAGVVLAEHTHTNDNMHVTIVISGSISITEDGVTTTRSAGDIIDLGTTPHSITALEPAVIINVTKRNVVITDTIKQDLTTKVAELDSIIAMAGTMKASLVSFVTA
jgi:quercetin dioxygenase-like cupin family protein